jgi:hypothetical protein
VTHVHCCWTHRFGFAVSLAIGLVVLGCGNGTPDDARAEFGRAYGCPEDRIRVSPRDDVKWSTVVMSGHETWGTPPPDVKKDPARLRKWQKDKEEEERPLKELLDTFSVFEARGCGHDDLVGCKRPAKHNGFGNPIHCEVGSRWRPPAAK